MLTIKVGKKTLIVEDALVEIDGDEIRVKGNPSRTVPVYVQPTPWIYFYPNYTPPLQIHPYPSVPTIWYSNGQTASDNASGGAYTVNGEIGLMAPSSLTVSS